MKVVRAVAIAAVVLVLVAYGFVKLTDNNGTVRARPRIGDGPGEIKIGTSNKLRLSPDGSRLAIVEGGAVTVVGIDDGKSISRVGRNVVDAAWMPDGDRVLLTEGPIPTGQVAVIDLKGAVTGVATLSPSIGFGDGLGVAVDSRATQAAVIAVTRDAIGSRQHTDLAVIGLQTGAVRVFATPERDELHPVFVKDDLVAVASLRESGKQILELVDVASGHAQAGPTLVEGPFVRAFGGEVVIGRRAPQGAISLVAVNPRTLRQRELHVTKAHRRVMAVDLRATHAFVRVADRDGEGHVEIEWFS